MKCIDVAKKIVEYREQALCVADELCIDIHLIQCERCREELEELTDLENLYSHVLVPNPETRKLEEVLQDMPLHRTQQTILEGYSVQYRPFRVAFAACLLTVFAISGFRALTHDREIFAESTGLNSLSTHPLNTKLRPWLGEAELANEFHQYTSKSITQEQLKD